ncbi:MAG TPA: hypothetical protein VFF17_01725, partial [Thermoanaerobaculia bacterium]|nr:hypothetical protein [Thermoanaerobaculia bacterium]
EEVGRNEEARELHADSEVSAAVDQGEEEVSRRPDDPIAADVEEAYRESDLPPARARGGV